MKIAMLGHKRIPSREGGVEVVVEELATRMVERGHQVVAYNRKGKHVSDEKYSVDTHTSVYKGIKIVQVPTVEKKGLNALIYSVLATFRAIFGKYDVIHFHAEGPCAMLWLPKLFGIYTVATIHGLDWQRAKLGGLATRYLKFGEKMAAKKADRLIVLSRNMQQYFMEQYQRETIYIPNGVAIPQLRESKEITKKFGLQGNDYILFLARIVPEKGVHYLLEAFRQIDTDLKLVIAGGSSHSADYYQEIAEMASQDERVVMTGFVQGQLLEELYSNCSVYILPSDVEGMPISLLEALAYGRSCLVSDIPENKELAGSHANYFMHGDVADLKEKLNALLIKGAGMQEENIAYVRDTFDWEKVVDQTLALYEKKD